MINKLKAAIRKTAEREEGVAFVLVLILLMLSGLLIAPVMSLMSTGIKTDAVYADKTNALYAADTGVRDAIWQLKNSNYVPALGNYTSPPSINVNGTTVNTKIYWFDNVPTYQIVATAGKTTVTSYVSGGAGIPVFDDALCTLAGDINLSGSCIVSPSGSGGANLFAVGNVNLTGSATITGDVYATANETFANSSCKITGNASASGTVGTGGTITGSKNSGVATQSPPSYSDLDVTVQSVYNETFNIGSIAPSGTSYPSGLTVTGQNQHYPAVNVTGNLTLGGNNTVVFDSQVYVTGNIVVQGGNQTVTFNGPVFVGGQLTSGGGTFNITFNSMLTTGNYVNLGGNGSFAFIGALKDLGDFSSGGSVSTSFGSSIYIGGNLAYSGSSSGLNINSDVYVNGTLTTTGSAGAIIGPVKVVVRGNGAGSNPTVSISGSTQLGTSQLPFLIIPPASTSPAITGSDPSSVQISGSGIASALIYAPTAAFSNSGGASLFGAEISDSTSMSGSAAVTYPSDLNTSRTGLPSSGGIAIKSYIIVNSATNVTGPATQLAFSQQPGNTITGNGITPAITVTVKDASGNTVTTSTAAITLGIMSNPGGGTLSGTTTVNAVNGVATFSGLSINKIGNSYTLIATSGSLTQVISNVFNITAGAATKLAFNQQPANTSAGATITPAVTVTVQDAGGNTVTSSSASITIAIGTNPGSGSLSGTTTINVANGVATFSGLNIDKPGTGYSFTAASTGLSGATSTTFNITAGVAAKLAFNQQPSNSASLASITPAVTVTVQDAGGNTVTTSTASITIAIGTNPGSGTLSGTLTRSAVNGLATFSGLNIDMTGTGYTLTAASTGLTAAASTAFNITAGTAAKLLFTTQPSGGISGTAFATQPIITVKDASGNTVTASSASITLSIGTNPGGGTLSGTKTINAVNGVATFSGLNIDKTGTGYTLVATSTSLTQATSNLFNITAGSANKLVFNQQPTNTSTGVAITPAVTITVQDAGGNTVTGSSASITIAIGTNPGGGTLSGTKTINAVNGVATFSNLSIDKPGTGYKLSASSSGLTGTTSTTFNVTASNPVPTITTISPTSQIKNTAFTLTVNGTNFVTTSVVYINTTAYTTTYINATQLQVSISSLAKASYTVKVTNPAPGGGTSNTKTLTITN